MNFWLIVLAVVVLAIFIVGALLSAQPKKAGYQYKRRDCIMTQSERRCYVALNNAIADKYDVFPQIHLPSFLDHKIVGQSWMGAFRHIDEKSVDFVLCDKNDLSPKLAIELDDRSHERPDRQERDREVERILKGASMPLLRLRDESSFENKERLIIEIQMAIGSEVK